MDGGPPLRDLAPSRAVPRTVWRRAAPASRGERVLPEEAPVSLAYQGAAYAVMMATPADLEDFAVGFSLSEGLAAHRDEIEGIEVLRQPAGVVLRVALSNDRAEVFWERRRYLAGPSGCGLCGLESLEQAVRTLPRITGDAMVPSEAVGVALERLAQLQRLNRETRAVHAAAFWREGEGVTLVREDVGRHNALDKLAGALARAGSDGTDGAVLLTSRVSVEMVQKAAMIGAPVLIAMSAPTMLAVRIADEIGMTLAAICRDDGFEIFTHPERFRDAG
jgi:FdhD protein